MLARVITGLPLPAGSSSWLDYYVKNSGAGTVLLYCAVCGCPEPPAEAVPMEDANGARFAVPLCQRHAGSRDWLELYEFEQIAALK